MSEDAPMQGKVCVVTGANRGLGKEVALVLAGRGARVIVVARNPERGEEAVAEISRTTSNHAVEFLVCDLASQASIRRAKEELTGRHPCLDVLVNNAAVMLSERRLTEDGYETMFATNHLGPFLLTNLLLPTLRASAPARVVDVSSGVQRLGRLDLDDPDAERGFSPLRTYATSKLVNMAFVVELARRMAGSGVTVSAVDPGAMRTGMSASASGFIRLSNAVLRPFIAGPERVAQVTLRLATASDLEGVTGLYVDGKGKNTKPARAATDPAIGRSLWELSERMTGLVPV